MQWLYLLLAVIANTIANIAFKKLALVGPATTGVRMLVGSPWFWVAGIACMALLGFYLLALRKIELGLAYACVTSGALVVISLLSVALFDTTLGAVKLAGIAAVILGIGLLMKG